MNKLKLAFLIIVALTVTVNAQQASEASVKRPRTPEDYQPGTLKELAAKVSSSDSRGNKMETMVVDPDISPTRVRARYAELTMRVRESKAEVIRQWARLYAGAPETYRPYEVEVLFNENGKKYWLIFTKKKLTTFWDSRYWSKPVDLFLIRMGAVKTTANKWEPVLLVEDFQKPK